PQSLVKYIQTEWIPVTEMWSKVSRQNRHIFEEGDTNMLIEAYLLRYHHVLKSKWLDGKRNCRFDHLAFILVKSVDLYYRFWHNRQQTGLDGLNLEKSHRKEIEEAAKKIMQDSIQSFD
ncbi:hypothetical protein EI94DRAFT_1512879, partial [Lactarius quietus]